VISRKKERAREKQRSVVVGRKRVIYGRKREVGEREKWVGGKNNKKRKVVGV
jgi:hypothetical protein